MLPLIAAGVQGAVGLAQLGVGLSKKKPEFPIYEENKAINDFYETSRGELNGLSREAKAGFEETRMAGAEMAGGASRYSTSGAGALSAGMGAGNLVSKGIRSTVQLGHAARAANLNRLGTASNMKANEAHLVQQNKMQKHNLEYKERADLINAGIKSMGGALGGAAKYGMAKMQGEQMMKMFNPTETSPVLNQKTVNFNPSGVNQIIPPIPMWGDDPYGLNSN